MIVNNKLIKILTTAIFITFFLTSYAVSKTAFHLFTIDSTSKINCEFLEIKNDHLLCKEQGFLSEFDTNKIQGIEVVIDGKTVRYKTISENVTNEINKINSEKVANIADTKEANNKKNHFLTLPQSLNDYKDQLVAKVDNNYLILFFCVVGLVILLYGNIAFIIAAFRISVAWGVCCILFPFVSIIFLIIHWKTAAKPFLISMFGIGIIFLGNYSTYITQFFPTTPDHRANTNQSSTITNNSSFKCTGKVYCSQMTSCAEAKFYLRNCPGTKMDGDNDGIPCENQWCGN